MTYLQIKVLPNSSCDKVVGLDERGVYKVKISSSPVDGQANTKLCGFLAKKLGVAKSLLKIKRGASSRNKLVEVLVDLDKDIVEDALLKN